MAARSTAGSLWRAASRSSAPSGPSSAPWPARSPWPSSSLPPISPPCCLCHQSRRAFSALSSFRPLPRTPSSRSPILTAVRSHAHYARDSTPPTSSGSRQPQTTPTAPSEREHELSEAAAKATQAHSGPEGHQKEKARERSSATTTEVGKADVVSEKEQSRRDWDIIKKLLPNVWPKNDWGTKTRVLLAIALLIGGKLLNVQVPFLFKDIVDTLNVEIDPTTSQGVFAIAGTVIIGCESPHRLPVQRFSSIKLYMRSSADGLARIGAGVFSELRNAVFANVAQGAIRRVARSVFTHLLNLDIGFHLKRQTGGLTRAIDRGTKGISFLLSSVVFHVVPTALEISMVCGILVRGFPSLSPLVPGALRPLFEAHVSYKFGWDFAALTLVTMGAYSWFTIRTTAWRTKFRRQANAADNRAATMSVDSLINYEAVKYFNNEAFEVAQYDRAMKDYTKASVKISTSLAALNIGQNVIFSTALTGMMYLAARGIIDGQLLTCEGKGAEEDIDTESIVVTRYYDSRRPCHGQPARLPAFIAAQLSRSVFFLPMSIPTMAQLTLYSIAGTVYRELRQSLIDMDALFNLQSVGLAIKDSPNAKPLALNHGGEIRFENVAFGYHPDRPIFKNVSFTIPAGKKVALVGPSGCGKSTVFRLLFRFYEPSQGKIFIDGQELSDIELESLRKVIGVVPQETPLFHSDIMHNIRYGRLDATDEEVKEAARLANVSKTIEGLPDRWETKVGERGMMISGGEKQRLAVARLLLKDPKILFFDEATSALDSTTEADLMRNINSTLLSKSRTSIFIAHRYASPLLVALRNTSLPRMSPPPPLAPRLKTVADADLIIVLRDGSVAEQGTHSSLMAKDGLYRAMWDQQNSMIDMGAPEGDAKEHETKAAEVSGHEGKVQNR
ncbi:SPOSA6832_04309, partial [Sporobolomyces salmonicolor]